MAVIVKFSNGFILRTNEINVGTIKINKNISIITGYVDVPVVISIDLNVQWCENINNHRANISDKWNMVNKMGGWDNYFPIKEFKTFKEGSFNNIWKGSTYKEANRSLFDKYNKDKFAFSKVHTVISSNLTYGGFIVLPTHANSNELAVMEESCLYGEISGNGILRTKWENHYNTLIQSALDNKLKVDVFDHKSVYDLFKLVHELRGSIYYEDILLMYNMAEIYMNFEEMEGFLIRGYITVPYIKRIGYALMDVYSDGSDIYSSGVYADSVRLQDEGCIEQRNNIICDKYGEGSKRYSKLIADTNDKYDVDRIRVPVLLKMNKILKPLYKANRLRNDCSIEWVNYTTVRKENILMDNDEYSNVLDIIFQVGSISSILVITYVLVILTYACINSIRNNKVCVEKTRSVNVTDKEVKIDDVPVRKNSGTQVDMVFLSGIGLNRNRIRVIK